VRLATVVLIVLLTVVGGLVHTPTAAAAQCGPRLSAYEGYRLRTVTLNTPFPFVRALGVVVDPSRAILPPAGSSLRTATVNDTLRLIEQSVDATPVLAQPPFTVTVAAAYIDNCDDEAREIDLIFYVLTSRFVVPSSFSWEFGETLRRDPATAAGLSARGPHLSLEPVASFNESDKFVAGARAAFVDPSSNFQLSADGAASQRYTNVAASASGSHDFEEAALWCASYGVGYRFQEQPLEHDDLRQGYAFGWVSAVTRPFPALGAPVRYAIQLEEGFQASQLAGAGFTSDTRYTALKLLTGASGGTSPHDYSLNLGWQLGSRDGFSPDWSKLLLDGAYTVRVTPPSPRWKRRPMMSNLSSRVSRPRSKA